MKKFRMKPVVVEAQQWYPGLVRSDAVAGVITSPVLEPDAEHPRGVYGQLETPNGWITLWPGDWVVRSPEGMVFVLGDVSFRNLYEPCEVG